MLQLLRKFKTNVADAMKEEFEQTRTDMVQMKQMLASYRAELEKGFAGDPEQIDAAEGQNFDIPQKTSYPSKINNNALPRSKKNALNSSQNHRALTGI